MAKYFGNEQAALKAYLDEIRLTPLLSPSEEKLLALRIRKGDVKAFHQLVKANLRFVVNVVKRYRRTTVSILDLINEGNVGLCRAAKKYNPDLGLRFISYAVWWIRNTIALFLARHGGILAIPAKKISLVYQIEGSYQRLFNELQRAPTPEELGRSIELDAQEVARLTQAIRGYISLDKVVQNVEEPTVLEQVLTSGRFSLVEQHFSLLSFRESLDVLLGRLSKRESKTVELYFGLNEGGQAHTFAELGRVLGISREGARLVFHRAIKKLSNMPETSQLGEYWAA